MEIELPQIDQEKIKEIKVKNYFKVIQDDDVKEFIKDNNIDEATVYENISSFMNYINSKKQCNYCPGLDKCPSKGICSELELNSIGVGTKLKHCKEKKEIENIKEHFLFCQTNEKFFNLKFNDIAKVFKKEREQLLKTFLLKNRKKDFAKSIYLYGNEGIGKSCIMSVFAKEIAKNCKDDFISYIDAKAMIPVLVDDYFNDQNSFSEDIELLSHCKFLFIDNFGQEEKTKTGKIEVLYKIINNRYERNLPTFFISRYSLQQIRAMYGTNINDSATNLIIKIINETCDVIELDSMKYPL